MDSSFNFFTLTELLLVNCLISYSLATTLPNITSDQSSLLALRSHITSDPNNILTSNWTMETSVCSWIGVTCSSRHLRVTALSIPNMGLEGIIPPEMGNLSFLVSLNMSRNFFHGNLSESFIHLRRLRVVDLSLNEFTGELPRSWFVSIPQLQVLRLNGNSLQGNIPEEITNLHDLKELGISSNKLTGSLPQSIFNMSSLELLSLRNNSLSGSLPINVGMCRIRQLNLGRNMFDGEIPWSLARCSQLQLLSLSYNRLTGAIPGEIWNLTMLGQLLLGFNNLSGSIPQEIGHLHNLEYLGMEYNNFTGVLPSTISNISSLRYLSFAYNGLSGSIPREIGNLTMLRTLYLSYNRLEGAIPPEIAYIHELEELVLANNSLTGNIPSGIFNMSNLRGLALDRNLLSGNVPTSISYNLPNLETLYLGLNNLEGEILIPISNCSKLTILELGFSRFSGAIPTSLENLSLLRILNLNGNSFTSDPSSRELSFITSLTNCRYLQEISLSNNRLDGDLPPSVGNFSASLRILLIDNCQIKGGIPTTTANLSSLETLSLMKNDLVGTIPSTMQGLQRLQRFFLGVNQLTGPMPFSLCTFPNLGSLDLSSNNISGPIPECLGNVSNLRELYLSNNRLDSNITKGLWNLKSLLQLDLSSNFLSGSLGSGIGNLEAAVLIDLSTNELSGSIPASIESLQSLIDISLANNGFEGAIPVSLGLILGLETLDLSQNNLSGAIPKSLATLEYLNYFNVSFNELSGEIPSDGPFRNFTYQSFMSNKDLCGSPRFRMPPCRVNSATTSRTKRNLQIIFVSLGVAVVILVIVITALIMWKKKNQTANFSDSPSALGHRKISYYELQQATDGFNETNLLGMGGFGTVYKGVLRDATVLAVKVFNLEVEGAFKSFDAECEVLRNLRHRNLTKIISSCSNNSFKAIILDYMPNGNLETWLYSPNNILDIMQRLNIMIDVACALEYLHYGYSNPVIHCDLKPSNVLLDEDMVAHVSDFGIAKLLGIKDSSIHTKTLATIGYMAPEYGMEGTVSPACDVYSYGIMLMEVFTRRRPNDEHFSGDLNMKRWVENSIPDAVQHIVDVNLLDPNDHEQFGGKLKCLTSIAEISMDCTTESPRERITARDIVPEMKKIKINLLSALGQKKDLNQ